MHFLVVLGIAIGLAMDAFAVSIATSILLVKVSHRQVFRFAFHFGLFQAVMPIIGWFAGRTVSDMIETWDHWVAFGLLAIIGGKAIYEALKANDGERSINDPTKGISLVMLSVATSIDALAVGLSFAFLHVSIWYPVIIIGVVTGVLSMIGMLAGSSLGKKFGKRISVLGGIILLVIGVKILVEHLTTA